jgi:predicted RNA-binding Zn-ribbon protein involved in translation (DUF1610 family)
MSKIIRQATALKITNKGGGTMRRLVPTEGDGTKVDVMEKRDTGSDYVVFLCPNCGRRNKMCVFESENYHDVRNDRIPFKCKICRTLTEVTRPAETRRIIIPGA